MRVLIDLSEISQGGAIQVSLAILNHAAHDNRHEWHVIASQPVADQIPSGISRSFASYRTIPEKKSRWDRIRLPARLLPPIENKIMPDVTFTVFGPAYWKAKSVHVVGFARPRMLAARVPAIAHLKSPRSKLTDWLQLKLWCHFFRKADWLVGESDSVCREGAELLGIPLDYWYTVRNAYSHAIASEGESQNQHRVASGSEGFHSTHTAFVPASYYIHKNLEIIPMVAKELTERFGIRVVFRLTLDEKSRPWIQIAREAKNLKVEGMVQTAGVVPHDRIREEYLQSDLVFLPTLLECSTAVYPESFALRVPVVTSDLPFVRDLCLKGAEYFDPRSPQSAAEALHKVLTDDGRRQELVSAGTQALAANYPTPAQKWEAQVDMLVDAQARGHRPSRVGLSCKGREGVIRGVFGRRESNVERNV